MENGAEMQLFEKHGRWLLLLGATLLSGTVLLGQATLFAKWAATALIILLVPTLMKEAAPLVSTRIPLSEPLRGALVKWLPFLIVGAATLVSLGPVTFLEMPVSQDHVNHYFGTGILVREMIPSGRIFGWTDNLGTGYPFGDIYHVLGYFVTGALYLLSFGVIPLPISYAFGIVVTWLLSALAVTALARRIAGPAGAAFAGVLFTLDAGGDREGGWGYAMFHGVWTQRLALGLWLFAILALFRLSEKPSTRRFSVAALLVGLSLWTHPMNGVTLLIAAMVMFGVKLFFANERRAAAEVIWPIAGLFFGGLIGLFWVIRMVVNKDVVYAFSSTWRPVTELMGNLLQGALFDHQWVLTGGLFIAGALYTVVRGHRFSLYALFLFATVIIIGSMDLIIASDAGLFGGGLSLMQYRRFSIPAKPLYYAFAGAGLSIVIRGITVGLKEHASARRPGTWGAKVFSAVALAPLAYGLIAALPGLVVSPAARPLTKETTQEADELSKIEQVLLEERTRCQGRCTAVYWEKPGHGGLYPVISFSDLGYRWLPMLRLPANNFDYQGVARDVETMNRLGATVAVSKWPQSHEDLKLLGRYGTHYVYRLTASEKPQVALSEEGMVETALDEPEEKRFQISRLSGDSDLILNMAPYKKWEASQQGRPLRVGSVRQGGVHLTVVEGVRNGEVVLRYDDSLLENIFYFLGALLFLVSVAGILWPSRPLSFPLPARHDARITGVLRTGFAAIVVAAGIGLGVGGHRAAEQEWLEGEPGHMKIADLLHHSGPTEVVHHPENVCVRPFTRDPNFGCNNQTFEPRLVPAKRRRGRIPACLAVGVPDRGETRLVFTLPDTADHIKGVLHLRGKKPVRAVMQAGNETLEKEISQSVPFELKASGNSFSVTLAAKRASEVCLEAVVISQ